MLITMVVTMVVFISLFNALNAIAKTKDSEIFYDINSAYNSQIVRIVEENPTEYEGKTHEEIVSANREIVKNAVVKEYKNQKKKHGFLWILMILPELRWQKLSWKNNICCRRLKKCACRCTSLP